MPDREKVIKGLEICTSRPCYCTDCPYKKECCLDSQNVMEDALALLKAPQEPRVLTLEEVLVGDECWFEYINGSRGYADVYVQDNRTAIIYRTTTRPVEVSLTDYMKKWRCWSYRPTEEQRKAVNWDDA